MKVINPDVLMKNIDDQFALLSLVEDHGSIKIQTLKVMLIILKNVIKDSIEEHNEEIK